MVDYNKLRKKFPSKVKTKVSKAAKIKAIADEFERKKAELGARMPLVKRGFPYYMVILLGMMIVAALIIPHIWSGDFVFVNKAVKDRQNARTDLHALAVALGRFRYHTGVYPTDEQGLEILAKKRLSASEAVEGWDGPYIRKLLQDPWKHSFIYESNGDDETPTLYSCGPDGKAGTPDDLIADPEAFDEPFKDTSWTDGWMPQHLRGYVVAQNERHKAQLEAELEAVRHPEKTKADVPLNEWLTLSVKSIADMSATLEAVYEENGALVTNDLVVSPCIAWTPERPYRQELTFDEVTFTYPVRRLTKTPEEGLRLNGVPFEPKGARLQDDTAPLLGAFDPEGARHVLRALKDLGVTVVYVDKETRPGGLAEFGDEIGILVVTPGGLIEPDGFPPVFGADGLLDATGSPTDKALHLRAKTNTRKETIALLPHWTWRDREGEKIPVTCVTSGDEAELFLNGDSIGRRPVVDGRVAWDVPYDPGTLRVLAYRKGETIGEALLETAQRPAAVRLDPEGTHLAEGELAYVGVGVVDDFDVSDLTATNEISFTVEGPGEIVALGTANGSVLPASKTSASLALAGGRGTIVVRRVKGSGKPVVLRATAPQLRTALYPFMKRQKANAHARGLL